MSPLPFTQLCLCLFLRLFIDKSSSLPLGGHRWLGLQRADPAIGDSASVRSAINARNDLSVIHRSSPEDLLQKTIGRHDDPP